MKKDFRFLTMFLFVAIAFIFAGCGTKTIDVTGITVSGDKTAYEGNTINLTATITPLDATNTIVEWSSSDSTLATVSNGVVSCLKEGTVTITAKIGSIEGEIQITINKVIVTTIDVTGDNTCKAEETIQLTATTNSSETVVWSSSDSTIATVSQTGLVTTLKEGKVTITAKVDGKEDSIEITVSAKEYTLDVTGTLEVEAGKTTQLTAVTESKDAVKWESSNTAIATVDANGLVTGVKEGTTKVVCTCGTLTKEVNITVTLSKSEIIVSGNDEVEVERTTQLTAKTGATGTITWESKDTSKATVDANGLVTGVAEGTVTITCKCGEITKDFAMTVIAKKNYVAFIGEEGYETITDALVLAEEGAVINVVAGTYTENIELFQGVTLLGPNASVDPNTGTRVAEAIITGTVTIKAGATGVTISGFEFKEGCLIEAISTTTQIDNITLSNNYFHDITEVDYTWGAGRNYDIPCFIKMGCAGNLLSNVKIMNNKFENIANVNVFVAVVNTFTLTGNTFTNFKSDAVRLDGGYNSGVYTIKNNTFKNDTLGGTNGLYFRSTGSTSANYGTELEQKIVIKGNTFENIGVVGTDFNGAISVNGYQEYGCKIECTYNTFKNCPNFLLFRNNATEANHAAYTYSCKVNYNVFIGETTGYYFDNKNATDAETTNPSLADFNDNLFVDNDGNIITTKATIETYVFGVKDFTSYLESYEDLETGVVPTIIVDLSVLDYDEGASFEYLGSEYVAGTTAFSSIEEAFDVCQNGDIIYLAADTYTSEITIDKSITLLGANFDINPNDATRKDETIISASITVEANDVTINGITMTHDSKIIGSQSGLKNLTIEYVVFDSDYTFTSGAVGEIELLTTDATKYFENISVMYTLFEASATGTRVTKIVATNVKNFTFVGNVCHGSSNGIYDDCLKFYIPSGQTTVGIQGDVLVQDNAFYDIGQYTVWFNSYGGGTYEIYNNYFETVGLTDGEASTYYRGAVTMTGPNASLGNVAIKVIGNEFLETSVGVRLENAGYTAETWSAVVNNNIFEDVLHTNKIITNESKNTLNLIDAKNNYYDIAVTAENFVGVSDFSGVYDNRDDVPKYIDPSKIVPTAIEVSNAVNYVLVGATYQIELAFTPSETTYKNVVYTSSDENIATVSRNGLVTGVASGTVTITIESKADAEVKKEITLTILKFAPENEIDEVLMASETEINMVITPEVETNQEVAYKSSNEAVATVDVNGKITALTAGTTKITVTSNYYTGLTYEFEVNVLGETKTEVDADIAAVLAILEDANVANVIHKSDTKVIGYQDPGYWMCDLYGSVSQFYFGSKAINTSVTTAINSENRPGTKKTSIEYITVHDTASIAASAGAAAHASYVKGGGGGTSWSFTIGADGIYFQIPTDEITYHAGDGSRVFAVEDSQIKATTTAAEAVITIDANGYYAINGVSTTLRPYKIVDGVESLDMTNYVTADINDLGIFCEVGENGNYYLGKTWYSSTYKRIGNYGGNRNSIGMETCVNQGADLYKTWQLTASLIAKLMLENDLGIDRVVQHHYFSGKDCPSTMRLNGLWDNLLEMTEFEYQILKDYSDYKITMVSNNPELVDNTGRVISTVTTNTTVTYTVTVSRAGVSQSKTFTSVIPA